MCSESEVIDIQSYKKSQEYIDRENSEYNKNFKCNIGFNDITPEIMISVLSSENERLLKLMSFFYTELEKLRSESSKSMKSKIDDLLRRSETV